MKFPPAQPLSRPKLADVAALFVVLDAMPCGFEFGQTRGEIRMAQRRTLQRQGWLATHDRQQGRRNPPPFPTPNDALQGSSDAFVSKISGLALPAVAFFPTLLDFPGVVVGTTSSSQPVTITNVGDAPVTITNIIAAAISEGSPSGRFHQTKQRVI